MFTDHPKDRSSEPWNPTISPNFIGMAPFALDLNSLTAPFRFSQVFGFPNIHIPELVRIIKVLVTVKRGRASLIEISQGLNFSLHTRTCSRLTTTFVNWTQCHLLLIKLQQLRLGMERFSFRILMGILQSGWLGDWCTTGGNSDDIIIFFPRTYWPNGQCTKNI